FHPFVDLLRHYAGIADTDNETEQLVKLERAVVSAGAPIGDVVPFVATLMRIPLSAKHTERVHGIQGEALEKLILRSLRELIAASASRRPLVLVFEDLHWADQSSVSLLEVLLSLTTASAVAIILVLRPNSPAPGGRIIQVARERYGDRYHEVSLRPLDDQQCDALLRNLLKSDDLRHPTRTLKVSAAEGNPFFIEEIVRSLIDQGAVEFSDGHLHVTEKLRDFESPATIQEVIMARLDRLPRSARSLLQAASVIGRNFSLRLIRDITNSSVVDDELAQLLDAQLIIERHATASGSAAADRTFQFTHALVQETIYGAILQATRRDMH